MSEFFSGIGEWIQNNAMILSIGTLVTSIVGGFVAYVVKKVIPATIDKILSFVTKIVTKMFGGTVTGVADTVQPVPIIAQMDEWKVELAAQKVELLMQSEMKLIELKNKLVSTKLSAIERIAYQALYDKIMLEYAGRISQSTLTTLAAIEQAAKERTL